MIEKRERKKVFDFSKEDDRLAFVFLLLLIVYIVVTVVTWFLIWPVGLALTIVAGVILLFLGCALVTDWVKYGEWFV